MRSLSYCRAGVGPSGRTPPTIYENSFEAREAVVGALEALAEEHPEDATNIDRVLGHLVANEDYDRFLDYFHLGGEEYVAFLGSDSVRP